MIVKIKDGVNKEPGELVFCNEIEPEQSKTIIDSKESIKKRLLAMKAGRKSKCIGWLLNLVDHYKN